ncbi:MAG: DUF4961 domain-containing protein [Bacteroidales bacterium]|nr:DUF4961 domain-containing protein [Bacteroidales bacterium]
MNFFKNHKLSIAAFIGAMGLVAACMYMDEIIFPDGDIKVNDEIEVTVKFHCVPETDLANTPLVLGILTPRSWDFGNNAKLYLTTSNYTSQGGTDVVNEEMELIPAGVTEFKTGMPWGDAFQSKLGALGNTGSVQWVAFKSKTAFTINDKTSTEQIDATVKIVMKTGPKNIKFFFGAGWCSYNRGFDDGDDSRYKLNSLSKIMTVTGGSGNDDYTVFHYFSTTPNDVRYGDVFSLNFLTSVSGSDLPLKGEEKIYFNLYATTKDGKTYSCEKRDNSTLMTRTDEVSYSRYIYPKQVFGLPQSAEITSLEAVFTNADGSIVCKDIDPVSGAQKNFVISQSDNKIKK